MDEIIVSQTSDIKGLILTVRDTQVLLDSDVAMLYGYETRMINQAATRNKERFPDRYRFQLTKEEYEQHCSKSQSVILNTGRGHNLKKLPFVYTEHGITMLAGLLRNKTAVQVSLSIVDAFVEMRRFISTYGKTFERIVAVEYKLLEHDRKFDELFDIIQASAEFSEGIFFKGQIYDAFKLIVEIIGTAEKSLVIVDNYADDTVLDMLSKRKSGVSACIITRSPAKLSKLCLEKLNSQYPPVTVARSDEFHDRFIIIDAAAVYHVGASLKDVGKKCFAITTIEDTGPIISKVEMLV